MHGGRSNHVPGCSRYVLVLATQLLWYQLIGKQLWGVSKKEKLKKKIICISWLKALDIIVNYSNNC